MPTRFNCALTAGARDTVPMLVGVAVAAGTVAYALKDLPFKLGLMTAVVVGVGVGMGLTRLRAGVDAKEKMA